MCFVLIRLVRIEPLLLMCLLGQGLIKAYKLRG